MGFGSIAAVGGDIGGLLVIFRIILCRFVAMNAVATSSHAVGRSCRRSRYRGCWCSG